LFFIILSFVVLRKIITKQNLFNKIKLRSILIILFYGFILAGLIAFIGMFIPKSLYNPYRDMSIYQMIILGLIIAPIFEELAFRGVILTYLRSLNMYRIKIFRIYLSLPVLLSAFLFSLVHINPYTQYTTGGTIWTLLHTYLGGIYLGYYFEKTRNIFVAVLGHFTLNTSSVLWALLFH